MLIRSNIINKLYQLLIIVFLVSAIWPTPAQATSKESYNPIAGTHHAMSFAADQEVDEDEFEDQEVNRLPLFSIEQSTANDVFYPSYVVHQGASLFFRYLFGDIASQAP